MVLKFFNTLSRKKEVFIPLREGKDRGIGIYNCGPTVYNYAHIGNLRAYCFADLLRRYLEYKKYCVKQVMNITDVDDKTINCAREEGVSLKQFTARYEKAFFKDIDVIGIKRASVYPHASEHIQEMIALIQKLLEKGLAYKGDDGSVYYNIRKFKDYGKLSHFKLDELKAGASGRLNADDYSKESVSDFALWKAWASEDCNVFWETPLGKGRPGWHIECSAMSMKYLGETFDIHTGGVDLIFPHHENEIAQSEGASGKPFVKYWLHCEHLLVDGRKMAKRFHNFYTLRDLLARGYSAHALRFLLLSTHYRSQLNFTFVSLEDAGNTLKKLDEFLSRLDYFIDYVTNAEKESKENNKEGRKSQNKELRKFLEKTRREFVERMDDDLDVANALAIIFALLKKVNQAMDANALDAKTARDIRSFLLNDFNAVFNVLTEKPLEILGINDLSDETKKLVEERQQARKKSDFKRADAIRVELRKKGFVLEDEGKDAGRGVRVKRVKV